MLKVIRKFVAMALYAFLLLPGRDYRVDSSLLRAVEVMSTSMDRTMRRRRAGLAKDALGRHLRLMELTQADAGDRTLRGVHRSEIPSRSAIPAS